jgi:rhodanese-related sulfurtransferase
MNTPITTRPMNVLLLSLMLILGSTAACQTASKDRVLAPDAYEQELSKENIQLIDVRTPGEYSAGHIANARLMDWSGGQLEAEWKTLDKDRPVVLYCASGRRSAAASAFLRKNGFTDITDLSGGFGAWSSAGKPVTK